MSNYGLAFAKLLRVYRRHNKLSTHQLAKKLGQNVRCMYRWESGTPPYRRTIKKICKELGVEHELVFANAIEESIFKDPVTDIDRVYYQFRRRALTNPENIKEIMGILSVIIFSRACVNNLKCSFMTTSTLNAFIVKIILRDKTDTDRDDAFIWLNNGTDRCYIKYALRNEPPKYEAEVSEETVQIVLDMLKDEQKVYDN